MIIEYRDLYDFNRNYADRKIMKDEDVPKGLYYITVMVFIENSQAKLLLQQRSQQKGGCWATTGGHPKSGESSPEGMIAEIKEEIGMDIKQEKLILFKTIKTEDDFVDLYYLKKDINIKNIVKQDEEVNCVRWFTKKQIDRMIKRKQFFKYHIDAYNHFLEFKKNISL